MKRILFLLIAITLSYNVIAQRDSVFIDKQIYKVIYSEVYKSPLEVTYKLYKPKYSTDVKRDGITFKKEPNVITATNKDFENNQFDKGHLAPAETFSDTKSNMIKTFTYVNCAVQHFQLNRTAWRLLEVYERLLAGKDSILVINKVIVDKKCKQLYTGTYIPSHFEKTIIILKTNDTLQYRFPNEECSHNFNEYKIK